MAAIWECTNKQYHADRTRIGSSMLKVALRSPMEYRRRYIDKEPLVDETTPALMLGSAFHCLVLEPENFDKLFSVRPEGIDGRTNDGKAKLADISLSLNGRTLLTAEQNAQASAMAKAVLSDPIAGELIAGSVRERAIVWDEEFGGRSLACKLKSDIFIARPDQPLDLILDLKSADDPTPECFGSGSGFSPIRKYGYDLSMYHYSRGTEAFTGRPCAAGLIVCGKDYPHDVFCYDITGWMEVGAAKWQAAAQIVRLGAEMEWRRPEQNAVTALQPTQWDNIWAQ